LLLLNNLAFQASDAERYNPAFLFCVFLDAKKYHRDHILSAVPSGMQISIWQVLAFILDSCENESIRDSVCCLISALLDKTSATNDNALEIGVIDRVPRKLIVPEGSILSLIFFSFF